MKSTADNTAETYRYSTSAKAITAMHRINQRGMNIEMDVDGQQTGRTEINGIVFTLGCFRTAKYNDNAKFLTDYLLMRFTEIAPFGTGITPEDVFRVSSIEVTLKEFQAMRGLKAPKNAREQFKGGAHALFNVELNFDYPIFRKKGRKIIEETAHVDGPMFICTEGFRTNPDEPLRNSRIIFTLNPKLLHYLCHRSILPVDVRMFAIDYRKHPHAFHLMRALTDYYHMNAKKKNEPVRFSIRAILEYCPELPKIDKVSDGHQAQLIMEPIDRDLDALEDTYGLIKHQYSHRKGKILTAEELEKMPFADWLDLMIDYYLPDYPVEKAKRVRKLQKEETQQEDTVIIPE
ncbi:MAG: hypothetical protein IJG36_03515 [Synergistaceae bacterium]|nr:hypothetical protein [Synergistaceae bacterium]